MYYVTMIDKFMSGWGMAKGKTNIYQVECDTLEEANQIERAAKRRDDMKNIRIRQSKPYFNSASYLVSEKHFDDLGGVWKEDE